MDKRILALIIVISIMFMAAQCGTTQPTNTGGTFSGGTNGVKISFKDTMVSEFQQSDSVPVTVVLINKGENSLNAGDAKVKLFGLNLANFGLTSAGLYKGTSDALKGVSSINPEGSEQDVSFGNMKYNQQIPGEYITFSQSNSNPNPLRAKVCYPYKTNVLSNVCIRSEALGRAAETGSCSLDGEKVVKGDVSSAPIQITSITEKTRGSDQVQFNIKIENKGDGDVYSVNSNCEELDKDSIKALDNKNKITYEIVAPTDVKCGSAEASRGEFTLIAGDKGATSYTLTCWKKVTDIYSDQLSVKLSYVYISQTTKDIKIYKTL